MSELQKEFYPNGIKIYPEHSILELTPLGFAMWYADDGTTVLVQVDDTGARSRRVQVCTDSFTQEEHNLIKQDLESLGYQIKLVDRKRRGQLRTQINGISQQKFLCDLTESFLNFPSLLYKLDLGYRGDSLNKKRYVTEDYKNCYNKISAHPLFRDRVKEKLSLVEDDIVQTTNDSSEESC